MGEAKVKTKKFRISPIWILPIVTAIIGGMLLISSIASRGHKITLIARDASGIIAGKTVIKSRNVDVGYIESIELSPDLNHVILYGVIDKKMAPLLKKDTIFWVVSPQISAAGVSGLSTIISGVYIELRPGRGANVEVNHEYWLRLVPPPATSDEQGLHITLKSNQENVLGIGAPVQYKGFNVGRVELSTLDVQNRQMRYNLFISAEYTELVTENVRFWPSGDIDLDLTTSGIDFNIPTLTTLLTGGVSFDLPQGVELGKPAQNYDSYTLYPSKKSIETPEYEIYKDYIIFFDSSIDGLKPGASVSFRGIQIGRVLRAPYLVEELDLQFFLEYIPVLVRIEPERLVSHSESSLDNLEQFMKTSNLRASLKTANLITGLLYIDIDSYARPTPVIGPKEAFGYSTIPATPAGLAVIENKLVSILDKLDNLQVEPVLNEMNLTIRELRNFSQSLNEFVKKDEIDNLPKNVQQTLEELTAVLSTYREGSDFHDALLSDVQQLETLLRQTQQMLDTLNEKSNSLIFKAEKGEDPIPKAKGR